MNVLIKKDPMYQKMYDEYAHCLDDPQTRSMALSREMYARDQASRIHNATQKGLQRGLLKGEKRGLQQGIKKGIEQGIEQGIRQGIEQGVQQGIRKSKIEVAQKLLSAGTMTDEEIAGITGLTVEEIKVIE